MGLAVKGDNLSRAAADQHLQRRIIIDVASSDPPGLSARQAVDRAPLTLLGLGAPDQLRGVVAVNLPRFQDPIITTVDDPRFGVHQRDRNASAVAHRLAAVPLQPGQQLGAAQPEHIQVTVPDGDHQLRVVVAEAEVNCFQPVRRFQVGSLYIRVFVLS